MENQLSNEIIKKTPLIQFKYHIKMPPITPKIVNKVSDTKTIGRATISFINSVLCICLTIVSGTSSVSSAEDAVLLRNLAIGFGAAVSVLNLFLAYVLETMIAMYTDNPQDEKTLTDMFTANPKDKPDDSIIEGTQLMLTILNQMKVAGNSLKQTDVNNQDQFKTQLKDLETALNKFGTIA
jgi:hypothetical protein